MGKKNGKHGGEKGTLSRGPVVATMVFSLLLAAAVAGTGILMERWLSDLPDVSNSDDFNYSQKTRVYANDGTTLLAEFFLENREPVTLDQISPYVKTGTVATEDERFYSHFGVDPIGIIRALYNNITGQSFEGGSTLTQQFVRSSYLADEASEISVKRKIREAVLAIELERTYSKEEILLMYLNTVNYGDGCYGIQVAANHYYQKNAADLTLAESASLIGIPQTPTNNNPVANPNNCMSRRNVVLDRMLTHNYITQAEYDAALATPLALNLAPAASKDGIYAYPYFTSYVRQTLLNQYSISQVFETGLTVYTTLDPALQVMAEDAAQAQYRRMADDLEVALTAIDPSTGYIKAMVGGKDYYSDQFNLATQSKRQAGSSFKTFTLAAAIEQGINPKTYIDCSSPATLDGWRVENYGNASYGVRSIESATTVSSNTGFARLVQTVTPDAVAEIAHRMGITSDLEAVNSITLGSQGVCTTEMADAYSTLATGGLQRKAIAITKIVDSKGATIFEHQDSPQRVLSPEVAYATTNVLKTVYTSGTATGARLSSGQVAAGKTGTSENWRDSWLCGYTPQLTCAVWIGARAERQMPASLDCSAVWRSFMTQALADQPLKDFEKAEAPAYNNKFNDEQGRKYGYPSGTYQYSQQQEQQRRQLEEANRYNPSNAPSVVGMTLAQAQTSLAGFTAEYVQEYSATVPAGIVISQEAVNGRVRLHVSLGPNPSAPASGP